MTDKLLAIADDDRATPITIAQADVRHHLHLLGPTGVGKSTLLLNLALQDIEAGRGVAVFDPLRGDLIRDLLARIPRSEWDRVVLIDPTRRERSIGLNALESADPDHHDLIANQIVSVFRHTYAAFWGPRTDDILRSALLTLLQHPGATILEIPHLLLHGEFRRELTARLDDPVGLGPFWEEYESWSDAQRQQIVAPLMNKLRPVLTRSAITNIIGQSRSTIDLAAILNRQGILLVNLSKAELGEDTSRLLGGLLFSRLWQTAQARAGRPEPWRPDFNLYLDEFQNYLHLPLTIDEVLVEARGLHLGLLLANQHIGQLSGPIREALIANSRTRIVFQLAQEDARYVARGFEPWVTERHLQHLARYQVAMRLCFDGRTERAFTAHTLPMPPSLDDRHALGLVDAALRRHGRPRGVIEAEIRARFSRGRNTHEDAAS